MHVESSMTYPEEFSRAVVPFGVTTVVADPHEIANVFGLEGILSFMEQETELDIFLWYSVQCSGYQNRDGDIRGGVWGKGTSGASADERVVCLGEVMNFKDLVAEGDTKSKRFLEVCGECGRKVRIEGHCPGLSGGRFSGVYQSGRGCGSYGTDGGIGPGEDRYGDVSGIAGEIFERGSRGSGKTEAAL